MENVSEMFKRPDGNISTSYSALETFKKDEDGQHIVLTRGVNQDGSVVYAVLFMTGNEEGDTFDIIVEYPHSQHGRAAAKAAAEIADKTLFYSAIYAPSEDEGDNEL